jgi:hypothetical protein
MRFRILIDTGKPELYGCQPPFRPLWDQEVHLHGEQFLGRAHHE